VRENLTLLEIRSAVDLLTLYLAGTEEVDAFLGEDPRLITDDRNWLERQMPFDLNRKERSRLPEILARTFAVSRPAAIERLAPGAPLEKVARVTALPRHPMLGGHSAVFTAGFAKFFELRGDLAAVRQVRAWRRQGAEDQAAPLTRPAYAKLVGSWREAESAGDAAATEAALRRLLEYQTQFFYYRAGVALTRLLARQGRFDEALATARELQTQFPGFPAAFVQEARIERRRGDPAGAVRAARRGLLFNPESEDLRALASG
jgi:tetratricopeptide (TPR) repeat protein